MIHVVTESGSIYRCNVVTAPNGLPCLMATKDLKVAPLPVVAIFPDRLPCLMDTATLVRDGQRVAGFNKKGVRTLLLKPLDVKVGMILANRKGLRSTRIVKVEFE